MTGGRRWGKAGVRLTRAETAATDARNRAARTQQDARDRENVAIAQQKWAAGLVVPHAITLALDEHSLYGPEVDIACGVQEPAVDLWEAGKLYPAWDQLLLLAKLTNKPARWFVDYQHNHAVVNLCYRSRRTQAPEPPAAPILRFPDEVVAQCPGTAIPTVPAVRSTVSGICAKCHRRRTVIPGHEDKTVHPLCDDPATVWTDPPRPPATSHPGAPDG
jgi:hypothetical protein